MLQTSDNGTSYYDKFPVPMSTISLFDTATGMWVTRNTTEGNMTSTRYWHTAVSNEQGAGNGNGSDSEPLSGGAIAGIIVGIIAATAIIAGALYFLKLRKRRPHQDFKNYSSSRNDIKSTDDVQPPTNITSQLSGNAGFPVVGTTEKATGGSSSSSSYSIMGPPSFPSAQRPNFELESTKPDGSEGQVPHRTLHSIKPDGSK
ncbi:hypothetical protein BDB00DRAFT_874311 [Zychaea mexicana]|uniref:uncharacterized protein n=1 Tax=Zychaea mexicana TaxID=64656 RepID=UPI0022FE4F68|nr:uncharacterized protein BDB00DRAFT_874311 [Zychaea mexicana]KAI9491417.1 hypothetical protein BDB00DRAFT_874311 [Zychaea mexicana]